MEVGRFGKGMCCLGVGEELVRVKKTEIKLFPYCGKRHWCKSGLCLQFSFGF
jgi:hypothetical protein